MREEKGRDRYREGGRTDWEQNREKGVAGGDLDERGGRDWEKDWERIQEKKDWEKGVGLREGGWGRGCSDKDLNMYFEYKTLGFHCYKVKRVK